MNANEQMEIDFTSDPYVIANTKMTIELRPVCWSSFLPFSKTAGNNFKDCGSLLISPFFNRSINSHPVLYDDETIQLVILPEIFSQRTFVWIINFKDELRLIQNFNLITGCCLVLGYNINFHVKMY